MAGMTRQRVAMALFETFRGKPHPTQGGNHWKAADELMARLPELKAAELIREIHTPWGIYTECGHEHTEAELEDEKSDVREVDLVGLVCDEGLLYRVCRACCVEPGMTEGYQTEDCVGTHTHSPEGPVCPTTAALDGVALPGAERWY